MKENRNINDLDIIYLWNTLDDDHRDTLTQSGNTLQKTLEKRNKKKRIAHMSIQIKPFVNYP